ncbi:tail completion protein gp17 [Massilia sp. S19_KUP03_FR1]|uniref:tail completion protein gp17 n=1 Tax=Massilia sp. S19_KUP03_FR1 TaxID=3025503 RepID=UPI002FCCD849
MDGVAVMRALLLAHEPLTALVGDNVVAGTIPADTALPAVGIKEIGRYGMDTVARAGATTLVTARIQVTATSGDYPQMKAVLAATKLGAGTFTGMTAGAYVCSVLEDGVGPELTDDAPGLNQQSRDYKVTYREPN